VLRVSNITTPIKNYAFRTYFTSSPGLKKERIFASRGLYYYGQNVNFNNIVNLSSWDITFSDLTIFGSGGPYFIGYVYQYRLENDSTSYCQIVESKNDIYVNSAFQLIYSAPMTWIGFGFYLFTTFLVFIYTLICPYQGKRPIFLYFYCCGSLRSRIGNGN
jgi:hypothetical protein